MSNSGVQLAFSRLRGRENYSEWKVGAKAYLTSKGHYASCITKLEAEATPAQKSANEKALAELTLLLDPSLYSYIEDVTEAKLAWDALVKVFEDKGAIRKVSLLKQWISLKSGDCGSMHEYVNKNVSIRAKVKNAGFDISDEIAGCILLCGLSEEYNPLVLSMEAKETITLDYVKNMLLQSIDVNQSSENAMSVKKFSKKPKKNNNEKRQVKCYECGGPHFKNKCPKLKPEKSEKSDIVLFTSLVTVNDYDSERSENIISVNDELVSQKNRSVIPKNIVEECETDVSVSLYALAAQEENDSDEWYVDSGATKHMTNIDHEMHNVKQPPIKQVRAANGEKMDIQRTGDLKCKINNNPSFVLSEVQYIPKLCVNLLSVSQMVKHGCSVIFDANGCEIFSKEKQLLAKGRMVDDMFKINIKFTESACATREVTVKKDDDIALWHRRLAHINFNTLKSDLKLQVKPETKCIVCAMGKHSRTAFNEPGTRAKQRLELIHTDVCGPMPVQSLGGAKYFVSFLDDFSRKVHVYTLKSKAEVFSKFCIYKKLVENELDLKIKCVRSDNGTEYLNKNFVEFFAKNGIKHEKTTPYSPQQNGLAERLNRTIVEKVRCMLFDSKLSKQFWGEALCAAVNVINAITHSSTKMPPNERWNGKKVNYDDFRVFGCRAMAWKPDAKRNKLDKKSNEYIYLRNADDAKAYRLYNVDDRKIIISRDVIFLEREDWVIDKNNLNDNSQIYAQVDEFADDLIEPESNIGSTNTPAAIVSGGSDDMIESTDAEDNGAGETIENLNDATVTNGEIDSSNDNFDSAEDTIIDDGAVDNTVNDPNFQTRARVDTSVDRPVTRSLKNLLNLHVAFSVFQEPDTYQEAMNNDNANEWKQAMREEFDSLIKNNTWILIERPPNVSLVDNKWVFKVKQEKKDAPIRYKARLVARGFTQEYGVNYFETFSPVVRFTSIRTILALAAQKGMCIKQFDVKTAFLNGELNENVYMKQPIGFDDGSERICKLQKSLYGLKQSSRCWNRKFTEFIKLFGFIESKYDGSRAKVRK